MTEITGTGEQPSDNRGRSALLSWLQLVRLPTVFTALSNILCGYFVTHQGSLGDVSARKEFWLLLVASSGLYLGGMVWNDIFDAGLDAVERPERPIPSGRISRTAAQILGAILMAGGILAATTAGTGSMAIACVIAVSVLFYDAVLKSTVFGPVGMAVCRFLNLLLGASAGLSITELFVSPQIWLASGLAIYVLGVTWFARNEAGVSHRGALIAAVVVVMMGIAVSPVAFWWTSPPEGALKGALLAYGIVGGHLLLRSAMVIRNPEPRSVQRMVGLFLLTIIFLDAIAVFVWTGDSRKATAVVLLVIPSRLMRRFVPMS